MKLVAPGKFVLTLLTPKTRKVVSVFGILLLLFSFVWGALASPDKKGPQISRDDLFSVTFPTENNGWACGRWGTVLRTDDSGKTWSRQETGTDYTLTSISFVDLQHGWAIGDEGTIIHTADGGKTWNAQISPVPFFLMAVQFVTPSKGWIVTERTHILSTEDGGKHWNIQFKKDDYILKSVSFCDPLNGWAAGEYGLIYHTKDGGKTWVKEAGSFTISERTGMVEGEDQLFRITAVTPQIAWAVGIDGRVAKTVDGGKNWKDVKVPVPKNSLFCIATNKTGTIAIGGKRAFVWSVDGGATWNKPEFKPAFTYGWLYGLTSRGASGFTAVGGEGAIYRHDGGKASALWQRSNY
ncbi:MAG: YCF48-related protein [Deltaproteobacteria bacterium]|nr:YCF48-related protein [Deltaproteobacteria bacterium]